MRNQRSSKTTHRSCCHGRQQTVTIGGLGLCRQGWQHKECANGRCSLHRCGWGLCAKDRSACNETSETQVMINYLSKNRTTYKYTVVYQQSRSLSTTSLTPKTKDTDNTGPRSTTNALVQHNDPGLRVKLIHTLPIPGAKGRGGGGLQCSNQCGRIRWQKQRCGLQLHRSGVV